MLQLSITQAVGIWDELRNAHLNLNGYGGNVAEIYAYRLMSYRPSMTPANYTVAEMTQAAQALLALIQLYQAQYPVVVTIEDLDPVTWCLQFGAQYGHRCHVQVLPGK